MRLRSGFLGVLLLVALILSGLLYTGVSLHKAEVTAQERSTLENEVRSVAHDLETRLHEKESAVALWASNVAVADHGSAAQRQALASFRRTTVFEGASVVAANGTMVALDAADLSANRREELVGQDFGDRTYVREAIDGDSHVSDPFEAESGNYVVIISAPIREGGDVVGTLNAAFHLTETDFFEQSTVLLSNERSLAVRTTDNVTLYDQSRAFDTALYATATVDGTGWRVRLLADSGDLRQHLRRATGLLVGGIIGTLLLVAALGVWASRMTIQQIERLDDGLDRLESGTYDTSLSLGPAAEWQRISDRFHSLATTLDRRESQLSVFNRVFRHNLRNDMSVVMLSSERILDSDETSEEVEASAQRIYDRAESFMATTEHARAIHEELLTGRSADPVPATVVTLVEDVAHSLWTSYPEAKVETSVEAATEVCGGRRLPLILRELGENAITHADAPMGERSVSLTARRDGSTVAFSVDDDGPGIPETERELLVGERQETPTAHGNGLGLWMVRWLVDSLDGTVSVSTPTDGGTTVTVRVPLAEDEEGLPGE
ncbi:sensor histidine kinase [Haloarcula marina]|uniref:sensor histidine kinase n=1 Tax=Haloarcula marina TaxID=2961574 RepID=UPI0020B87F01|nr:sensor histidine kinase [Halomicroarcula marina]